MKKIICVFASIILISCGSTKLLTPTQADADRGSAKFSGLTLASLNEGKANFETHCTTCHGLKDPKKKTEDQWKSIVPRMAQKANKKAGKEVIDAAMEASILQYVVTMGK